MIYELCLVNCYTWPRCALQQAYSEIECLRSLARAPSKAHLLCHQNFKRTWPGFRLFCLSQMECFSSMRMAGPPCLQVRLWSPRDILCLQRHVSHQCTSTKPSHLSFGGTNYSCCPQAMGPLVLLLVCSYFLRQFCCSQHFPGRPRLGWLFACQCKRHLPHLCPV